MTTELVRYQSETAVLPTDVELVTMLKLAEHLHKSRLLPKHIVSTEAAFAIIIQGRELGIGAMQALRCINLIEGRLTPNADLMAALIYRRCGDRALRVIERTAERCTIEYQRPGWSAPTTMTWTMEMATRAGLTAKDNWRRHPDAMLYARCLSAIAHTAFQDVVMGLYTPDEAEEIAANERRQMVEVVDQTTGEIIDAPARAVTPVEDLPITEGQRKRLFAVAREQGWADEALRTLLRQTYPTTVDPATGRASTSRLTRSQADELIGLIEDTAGEHAQPEPATDEAELVLEA